MYKDSIEAIQILNKLGYGRSENLQLNLVYNPATGIMVIPGKQEALERDYKNYLKTHYDIDFNHLYSITNMPIKRFADDLYKEGKYVDYMQLLLDKFNPSTVHGLMCTNTLNVQWDGKLYDCDFNAALEIPIANNKTIFDIHSIESDLVPKIETAKHCYGCTAGAGSSCGGALI